MKQQMHRLLLAEQQRRPLAVLMITHDVMEAVALADQVLVLAGTPARLRWRLDLALPAARRDDAWVHRQTALLLAQPAVRAAFDLPQAADQGAHAIDAPWPHGMDGGAAVGSAARMAGDGCEVPL